MSESRQLIPRKVAPLAPLVALAAAALLGAAPLSAQQETKTNTQVQLPSSVEVPGQGTFGLSGSLHIVFFVHRDNAGGVHVRAHANAQGVTVTKPGGATCRGVGAVNITVNVGAPKGAASEGTAVANLGLICPGREPNLRLHANLHVTVNANNEVTATVANVRITS
jgi:hypothetical protein